MIKGTVAARQVNKRLSWNRGRGAFLWLRADSVITVSTKIDTFVDRTGNVRNYTQTTDANRATASTGGAGGRAYAACSGGPIIYNAGSYFSTLTQGELFVVFNNATDPPTGGSPTNRGGIIWLGNSNTLVPNVDGLIYDGALASARQCNGVAHAGQNLSSPFVYNVRSASGLWANDVNNTNIFTTASNTFQISTSTQLLMQTQAASGGFAGNFYEFLLFPFVLSSHHRARVKADLYSYYAITP